MTTAIECRSTDGLALEALLDEPSGEPRAGLILCHPHPKMGGTMNAPLLDAVATGMVDRQWAVLRFNFRGIGESEGESSTGLDEVADAEGAIEFMQERLEAPLAIGGWSFGAAVAVRTANGRDDLSALAAIAPAVRPREGVTAGVPSSDDLDLNLPALVVCGSNDDQVDPADCRAWAESVGARYEEVPAANHFFWAKYDKLAAIVGDFLDDAVGDD